MSEAQTAIDTLVQIAQSGQFEAERIRAACEILDRLDVIERVNFAAAEEEQ